MKQLFLQRHAKANKTNPALADFDRPLHPQGLDEIKLMSTVLLNHHVKPDQIIASQAKRAIETARTLAAYLEYPLSHISENEELYSADFMTLINIVKALDDHYQSVMIVGHNPYLSLVAGFLCKEAKYELPPCGIYCLQFRCQQWKEIAQHSGQLQWVEFPEAHQR